MLSERIVLAFKISIFYYYKQRLLILIMFNFDI
jgi:hypothetical protein